MNIIMKIFRSNVAEIGTPAASDVTHNSMTITGKVEWYKGDATWGVAYKKHSATKWTHSASSSKSISKSLTGLDAETKYDIKLYVKFNDVYQYGPAIEQTTEAAPVENPPAEPTGNNEPEEPTTTEPEPETPSAEEPTSENQ